MSRELPFTKMHGAGNDFVVLDGLRDELPPPATLAARLLDRHFGIGGDQLLVVRESRVADFRMEIFNPDGSQVEMCANGIRAFYLFVRNAGHTTKDEIAVETLSGVVYPRGAGGDGEHAAGAISYLESPPIDCRGHERVLLRYQRWLTVTSGDCRRSAKRPPTGSIRRCFIRISRR